MEAYPTYPPLNPEAPETQMAVNLAFINQAAPASIKKKLQWPEGFKGKNLTELIAITTKVYNNREEPEDKKTWGWLKSYWQSWRPDRQRECRLSHIANG